MKGGIQEGIGCNQSQAPSKMPPAPIGLEAVMCFPLMTISHFQTEWEEWHRALPDSSLLTLPNWSWVTDLLGHAVNAFHAVFTELI